ncbi:hypothetical protein LCGC14_0736200 [marine sediment metagenome]|uniref:Uncharacterized protein n=1 Tax=marine sediment metagenome TaxID=412755 RepID=A0A0F9SSZ4_9ZZZZ
MYGLIFNVLEGGVIEPIKWGREKFLPDTSIIILDESSEALFLWHGARQGLVARRTALRQAESLKGHGYTVGKSIIGRDLKSISEIDARKIGKVPEDTALNEQLQVILDKKFTELDDFVVTFQSGAVKTIIVKDTKPKPAPVSTVSKTVSASVPASKPTISHKSANVASEYDEPEPLPSIRPKSTPAPSIKVSSSDLLTEAKISFVISAILEHFSDVWVSKKTDGSYAVEMMDGPICQFSIKEGAKLNFTANSFSGIDSKVKLAIQKKFVELSKLL